MSQAYTGALRWLLSLVDLERQPMTEATRARMTLDQANELAHRLGRPQDHYPSILIAGSKGKGSTATMLASILQSAGRRTGLYTQPHLHSYRERVQIDGRPISESDLVARVARLRPEVEAMAAQGRDCTTFEVTTALALDHFARAQVDVAVLEVGLGGRLDATNIVDAEMAVIAPISVEHTAVLGATLPAIAFEKAGIIKHRRPILSAPQHPDVLSVLQTIADERLAPLGLAGRDWRWEGDRARFEVSSAPTPFWKEGWVDRGLTISLHGVHQIENAALAAAAAHALEQRDRFGLNEAAVARGLASARLPARIEVVRETGPGIVVDSAHNGESARKLASTLAAELHYQRLFLVLGVLGDKDLGAIISAFGSGVTELWAVKTRHPRSRPAAQVAAVAAEYGIAAEAEASTASALKRALAAAGSGDLICVAGSLSTAAEAREALGLVSQDELDPQIS